METVENAEKYDSIKSVSTTGVYENFEIEGFQEIVMVSSNTFVSINVYVWNNWPIVQVWSWGQLFASFLLYECRNAITTLTL